MENLEKLKQTTFSEFLTQLETIPGADSAAALAEAYLKIHKGHFPLIEGTTAHFLHRVHRDYRGAIAGEWNGNNPKRGVMTLLPGGLEHYAFNFEPDARLDYLIVEQGKSAGKNQKSKIKIKEQKMLDPLNSRTGESGFGFRSELQMPAYSRPSSTLENPGIPRGRLEGATIKSRFLKQHRAYSVYLPPGYNPEGRPYPTIYLHDGGDYIGYGKALSTLDNLIYSGQIRPLVAVFVSPVQRLKEYNCNSLFLRFFTAELIPEMHRLYNLDRYSTGRAICGPSLGGLTSLYFGAVRPDLFGLVGAQSSVVTERNSFKPFDARKHFSRRVKGVPSPRFQLVIGTYEDCFKTGLAGECRDLLNPVRELEKVLSLVGYEYGYAEHHQGHSWGLWRDTLPAFLTAFFPG